jgi:branched-subunit amino acid transport protein
MTPLASAVIAGAALAAGTYAIRLVGPMMANRLHLTKRGNRLVDAAAVVILFAVMATSTLTDGRHLADIARPAGVFVAVVLVLRRAAFLVVVIAAAVTTAVIRYAGH